jgi:hypothetical protein
VHRVHAFDERQRIAERSTGCIGERGGLNACVIASNVVLAERLMLSL